MVNKEELKDLSLAFSDLGKYETALSTFRGVTINAAEKLDPTQLLVINKVYVARKNKLEEFKAQLERMNGILNASAYTNLSIMLNDGINLSAMLADDSAAYMESRDSKHLESVLYGLELDKELSEKFTSIMERCEMDLSTNMLKQVLDKELDLGYLETVKETLEPTSTMYSKIEHAISYVETRQKRLEKQDEEKAEQVEQPIIQPELSLEQKLDSLNYQLGESYYTTVQSVTNEHHMVDTATEIKDLEATPKKTFKESMRLYMLKEQELELEKLQDKIDAQNLSPIGNFREQRLEKRAEKIEKHWDRLRAEQELAKEYGSKTMQNRSLKKQEKIANKIQALQKKNGELQAKQRASAFAKYNKQLKRIERTTSLKGFGQAISGGAKDKIEQLKAIKAHISHEAQLIIKDNQMVKNRLEALRGKQGVIPDNIISLEEHFLQAQAENVRHA